MTTSGSHHLLRVLGTAFGIAVVVGGTVGQGIMRTPGIVAGGLPIAWMILALWLAGGLFALVDSMSAVELSTSIQTSGGPYAFTRRAFGPVFGLGVGLTDWLAIARPSPTSRWSLPNISIGWGWRPPSRTACSRRCCRSPPA